MALILDQHRKRALDVALARFRSGKIGGVVILERFRDRPGRERAQAVAVEIGQDREQPGTDLAAVKQMLGAQRANERILHEIIGGLRIAGERAGVTAQRWNGSLDALMKTAHPDSPDWSCV